MMAIIVGIDPSINGTAVCVLNANYEIELIKTIPGSPVNLGTLVRIDKLRRRMYVLLKRVIGAPRLEIFIEGYSFGSKGRAGVTLGELGMTYRRLFAKKFGGYYEIPPTNLKLFITGKGNIAKNVMLEKTFRKYGVGSEVLKDDDQVDAYGLARMGAALLQWKSNNGKFTDYEIRAMTKIGDKCRL